MVAVVVSSANRCYYCLVAHGQAVRRSASSATGVVRGAFRARQPAYGRAAGCFFKHREKAVLVFVATTLPQLFLLGESWPREMVPPLLDHIQRVFPSEPAIDGLVRINHMGAALGDHHLNTFPVRADLVGSAAGLQPGMSVWLNPVVRAGQPLT